MGFEALNFADNQGVGAFANAKTSKQIESIGKGKPKAIPDKLQVSLFFRLALRITDSFCFI